MADTPIVTASLARLRPAGTRWRLRWSTAGHPAQLLLVPEEPATCLDAEPGLPWASTPALPARAARGPAQ